MKTTENRRILLIDDMAAIHEDYRKILTPQVPENSRLGAAETALFGEETPVAVTAAFELDSAFQGEEGLAKVEASLRIGLPYAMAFVDMRMPPGWDGVETIERLWRVDPQLQIVICTAYSDTSWDEVLARLEVLDRLLILKKPFDAIEVWQLANTLTAKWASAQQGAAHLTHLEVQLVQSEKLASIGQLAAGVAHEINNPIGYIFSNFGTLETYLDKLFGMLAAYERAESSVGAPDVAANLRRMREEVELDFLKEDIPVLMRESKQGIERVRQIVQDLKDFSHVDSTLQWQYANLHQGIDSTLNVVASEIKYKADVLKEYGALPDIECLPSQINQVVMNLVVNAAHAIGEPRGRITIRTGTEGEQVWLEVSDTGAGIAPDIVKLIFEPFFTTKPVGKGTGLGLSVSYGIVQLHAGRIDVESVVGKGTTFRVTLPKRQPKPHGEALSAAT